MWLFIFVEKYFLAFFNILCSNYSRVFSGFAWRILLGPVNDKLAMLILFYRHLAVMFVLINLSEIMIFNVISLFGWKHICCLEEDFFSILILIFNIGKIA